MKSMKEILGERNLVDFLIECKLDFKFFCENVLTPLFPKKDGGIKKFHLEWFHLIQNNDRVAISAPSGFGKSTILGIAYPLWLAFNYRNKQILVVSKTLPQSTRILEIIRTTIEDNELLMDLKPKNAAETWKSSEIKTRTRCRIFCRPFSINIKGERVDYILMDEAASYDKPEIYFDYIIPRLNPKGKIVLISTPESPGDLMARIRIRKLDYAIKTYPAIVNGKSIWPERFSIKKLEKLKEEQGEEYFEKNFMCNPLAEPSDAIFNKKAIYKCLDPEKSFSTEIKGRAFIGCDFAISASPTADFDAYVVIDKVDNFFIIRNIEIYKGTLIPAKINRIEQLKELYNPIKIRIDESNIGSAILDEMRGRALPVIPQGFHSKERRELLNTLRNVVDSGKLIIPFNKADSKTIKMGELLIQQLVGFKEVRNEKTGNKNFISTAPHDDVVMALALAIKEATIQKSTRVFVASAQ